VIGRGFGEKVVARAFGDVDGCEVVDVVSPRDEAAVAALCGRGDVDLVSVHSPPFLHRDHVLRAVDGGHHVLCDKPFGCSAADAVAMRDAAEAAGVRHFLNFENRAGAGRLAMYDAIAGGVIGTPEHVAFTLLMSISRVPLRPYGWLFDAASGGGWLRALGSHYVDFVRWNFGEVVEASGQLRTAVTERFDADGEAHQCTADDGFVVSLRTEGGVTVALNSSSAAPVHAPGSLLVVGSDAVLEEGAGVLLHRPDGPTELYTPEAGVNPLVATQTAYASTIRDSVRTGEVGPHVATFDDGVACNEVMDRIAPISGR
jgi:predicted dehydrogenase